MLWVCCITFNLYMNIIRNTLTIKFEKWYHRICWQFSLVVSLIPCVANQYGPSGSWCWIMNDRGWQFGIWYGPLAVVLITLTVVFSYIIYTLYRKASNWAGTYDPETRRTQEALKDDIKQLRLYPFAFLLLSLFPIINRIQNGVSDKHVFALVLLHAVSSSLQGASYSIVFGFDREILRSLTPLNIKLAIQKKRATPVVLQEYSAEVVIPDIEHELGSTDAHAQMQNSPTAKEVSSQQIPNGPVHESVGSS